MKHFLIFLFISVAAQGDRISFGIDEGVEMIYSDNLDQVYTVKGSELKSYSNKGKENYSFNDVSLGSISFVDVNLALKPLLFYVDIQALVLLDNTLSQQGATVYPVDNDFSNVTRVCHSADNNFWFFERDNFELVRVDRQMNIISRTGSLDLLLGRTLEPDYMIEKASKLYLKDPVKGIYVFDIYGNWIKTIPLNVKGKIEVYNELIYFIENGEVRKYNQRDFLDHSLDLPNEKVDDFSFQADRIFTKKNDRVEVFRSPSE